MQLTFVTDLGQSYAVEIDPDMELENVMALLEAEVSRFTLPPSSQDLHISILFFPFALHHDHSPHTMTPLTCVALDDAVNYTPSEQSISHNGRELTDPKATIRALGVSENAMLLLRRRVNVLGLRAGKH